MQLLASAQLAASPQPPYVLSLCLTPDHVAIGDSDGSVRILDEQHLASIFTWNPFQTDSGIAQLASLNGGRDLWLSGTESKTIQCWDTRSNANSPASSCSGQFQ